MRHLVGEGVLASTPPTVATFDSLVNLYLVFGVGAGVIVTALMIVFMVRYRYKGPSQPPLEHKAEGWQIVLVTVMISITILGVAEYQTFASFSNLQIPDDPNAVHITVTGRQFSWSFTYPNNMTVSNELVVPANRTVILDLTTIDVMHSFGITALAVKEDAVPGKTNHLWFRVPTPEFMKDAIRCFELCGPGHAFMVANLSVVDQPTWDATYGGS